jgi:formylglycine-generating enzyme required for sulfatase activity
VEKKLESIFTTTEDCLLEIDGRSFGTLLKDEPKMIPLDFGQHKLLALGKTSRELYNTTITILGNNQAVKIPFREALEEEIALEDNLESSSVAAIQSPAQEAIKINKTEIAEPVPYYVSRASILQTVSELSSNMVALEGGKFEKGDAKTGSGRKSKDSVMIAHFLLGRFEITQQQWQQVMGYNNSENKNCNDCPVENVSWNEIAEFVRILNENSDVKFRLPTDAEWEYTVRLDIRQYIDKRGGPRYGDNVAWNDNNAQRKTHSVGTRIPHRSGAYDLMGNVAEWCSDWYDPEYLKNNKNLVNPVGPSKGTKKIVRGGTYSNKDFVDTKYISPNEKLSTVGFRLVQY